MIKSVFYPSQLKPISRSFLITTILDILTTILGLSVGAVELNIIVLCFGWYVFIFLKILVVFFVIWVLEGLETFWFFWVIPLLGWLVVANNIIVILGLLPLDKIQIRW